MVQPRRNPVRGARADEGDAKAAKEQVYRVKKCVKAESAKAKSKRSKKSLKSTGPDNPRSTELSDLSDAQYAESNAEDGGSEDGGSEDGGSEDGDSKASGSKETKKIRKTARRSQRENDIASDEEDLPAELRTPSARLSEAPEIIPQYDLREGGQSDSGRIESLSALEQHLGKRLVGYMYVQTRKEKDGKPPEYGKRLIFGKEGEDEKIMIAQSKLSEPITKECTVCLEKMEKNKDPTKRPLDLGQLLQRAHDETADILKLHANRCLSYYIRGVDRWRRKIVYNTIIMYAIRLQVVTKRKTIREFLWIGEIQDLQTIWESKSRLQAFKWLEDLFDKANINGYPWKANQRTKQLLKQVREGSEERELEIKKIRERKVKVDKHTETDS